MSSRNTKRYPKGGPWRDLGRLRSLLENSGIATEAGRLLEDLEQRLAWVEEDNRSYRTFFENLISVLEADFQPDEVRTLIQQLGLREILVQKLPPQTDTIH